MHLRNSILKITRLIVFLFLSHLHLGASVHSQPPYYTEVVEGYLVTAPNGNRLWINMIQPRADLYPGQSFPAIVDVSGGLGFGEHSSLHLAMDGFVEFHFNPEGRGRDHPSEGEEDYNGFIHQDDLKTVIEFAYSRPNVVQDNIGVMTHSFGITIGAGCLGRYPELPVKYLVDVEGPSESFVTCHEPWSLDEDSTNDKIEIAFNNFGHCSTYRDSSEENQTFWAEREATRFIGSMRCRYLRLQAEWDHAQPPNAQYPEFDYPPLWYQCKHGIDLVNLATLGMSPWTRVNGLPLGNPRNILYNREHPPVYYEEAMSSHQGEQQFVIREMAMMPARITTPGDVNGDGVINILDVLRTVNMILNVGLIPIQYELWAADCNDDGSVDILDVIGIINVIMGIGSCE